MRWPVSIDRSYWPIYVPLVARTVPDVPTEDMPYPIDTDWIIDYLSGDDAALALLENLVVEGIAISVITYMESTRGSKGLPIPTRSDRRSRLQWTPCRSFPCPYR